MLRGWSKNLQNKSIWWMAAILKNGKLQLSNHLTNFDGIWHGDIPGTPR